MTKELLKGICAQAANMAKVELRAGRLNGMLCVYLEGYGLTRWRKVEKTIERICGEDWIENGAAKASVGELLALMAEHAKPEAIVIAALSDYFIVSESELDALPKEDQAAIRKMAPSEILKSKFAKMFDAGEMLDVTAQTPELVCQYLVRIVGGEYKEPQVNFAPQSHFRGRLKLWGRDKSAPENFWSKKG